MKAKKRKTQSDYDRLTQQSAQALVCALRSLDKAEGWAIDAGSLVIFGMIAAAKVSVTHTLNVMSSRR